MRLYILDVQDQCTLFFRLYSVVQYLIKRRIYYLVQVVCVVTEATTEKW